jgi:hypothetical protein
MKDTLVVTATLGDRDTLNRTITTVQKYGGNRVFHVIVAPLNKCEELKTKYPLLEVISEPKNCNGIYGALNFGLNKYAKNFKYLTYINDDDYWFENYQFLFKELDANDNLDAVYGKVNFVDDQGSVIASQASSSRYKAFKHLLSKNIVLFTQQATLIKSDLFIKTGGYDESYKIIADTKFWLNSIEQGARFKYLNMLCAGYTIQEGQISSDGNIHKEEHVRLIKNIDLNPIISMFEIACFRIVNIPVYVKRFIGNGKIQTMESLFHS